MASKVLIALGANISGIWGTPNAILERSLIELSAYNNLQIISKSPWYNTKPVGLWRQPIYLNGIISIETYLSPDSLLCFLKQVERYAGRRGGRPWGPRTLDLDILSYKGLIRHWDIKHRIARSGRLILPHPHLHERPFVLRPLLDVAPEWRHPVFQLSVRKLLLRCGMKDGICHVLD